MNEPTKVESEVMEAYCDSRFDGNGNPVVPWEEAVKRRNLSFRASQDVSRDEAIAILSKAVPSYNAFKPSLLKKFDPSCRFTIAREGSVCLYVKGLLPKRITADDVRSTKTPGETRVWWD